jgi:hypothetical protein
VPDEAANCVNSCTSPLCFGQVYGPEVGGALEDGEVDSERERKFTTCLRQVWAQVGVQAPTHSGLILELEM